MSVLVIDDERSVREGLGAALRQAGHEVDAVESLGAARRFLATRTPGCILLDVRLKDGDGLDYLLDLRRDLPLVPVIVATAFGDSDRTIQAMKSGAFDYVTKPFDLDALLAVVARAVRVPTVLPVAAPVPDARLVGASVRMLAVWKAIGRATASMAPVLVTGETGTGKELIARAIHEHGPRADEPFVAVNVASLPASLVESELFGHEKGAFTGAAARREGRFETAGSGTLFLDEIGDLDLATQSKLLRVLQDGVFERVGGQAPLRLRARVVAATSRPVAPHEEGATLREDLYYRLGVITIAVPPLRERKSDIPLLVQAFLARRQGLRRAISEAAMARLAAHDWPGNVRELLHVVERACVMAGSEVLDVADLDLPAPGPEAVEGDETSLNLRAATTRLEIDLVKRALVRSNGNRAEAARLLGLARPQLYAKMRDLGLAMPERGSSKE